MNQVENIQWVPVLMWDEGAMYEGTAIAIFLCDRHPEAKLAPEINDLERGLFLQTLFHFSNAVQNAFQLDDDPDRFAEPTPVQHTQKWLPLRGLGLASTRLLISSLQPEVASDTSIVLVDDIEHGLDRCIPSIHTTT
ncbi:MAG: hypothetical protein ACSHWY_00255 [Octadecabacter sp.]